jgi:hypothetical protein
VRDVGRASTAPPRDAANTGVKPRPTAEKRRRKPRYGRSRLPLFVRPTTLPQAGAEHRLTDCRTAGRPETKN